MNTCVNRLLRFALEVPFPGNNQKKVEEINE
jgi:hypothetical protein